MYRLLLLLVFALFITQCAHSNEKLELDTIVLDSISKPSKELFNPIDSIFDRSEIKVRLNAKMVNNEPLIVHLFVPLCDNIHQGIVPTSKSLGDGLNLKTNLYWATSGGTKSYFKNNSNWSLEVQYFDIDTNVLERLVFKQVFDQATVYLVADAYRGDRMEETVNDFLASIANCRKDSVQIDTKTRINCAGSADLIMFNGHNGAMDAIEIKEWINRTDKRTDIVMNSCVSYDYLQYPFMIAGGYPLVRSKTLLYPGAYVLDQIIKDWVNNVDEKQLCLNAGRTYCNKHNCGKGTKVYQSGW